MIGNVDGNAVPCGVCVQDHLSARAGKFERVLKQVSERGKQSVTVSRDGQEAINGWHR